MVAGLCLLASRRGEDTVEGLAGAMVEAEAYVLLSRFLTAE